MLAPDQLPDWSRPLVHSAAAAGEDIDVALALCAEYGARLPLPGGGCTPVRLAVLAALGRVNLTVARVFEAHTDAVAILAEAGADTPPSVTWGVFAAEAAGARLEAHDVEDGIVLSGTKPWCSLGGRLDAALVTAHRGEGRQLFRVDLQAPGVRADPPQVWVARGLRSVTSGPVHFEHVPAQPVGEPGWYLTRSGFAWGGIGVAACWFGGALGVADAVSRRGGDRIDDLVALHVGTIDAALHGADAALRSAAAAIDSGSAADPELLALRTRAVVADAVERTLQQAGHALGPAPLAFDPEHSGRVADLELYVRQHHAERDLAALGRRLLATRGAE